MSCGEYLSVQSPLQWQKTGGIAQIVMRMVSYSALQQNRTYSMLTLHTDHLGKKNTPSQKGCWPHIQ